MVLASSRALFGILDTVLSCANSPRPRVVKRVGKHDVAPVPICRFRIDQIYADMAALFVQDLANVEAGVYPLPVDHDGSSHRCSQDLPRPRTLCGPLMCLHSR